MAKIGILSMQRINNYGSFLQAYAMKTMLEKMGHDVQFVDYHVGQPLIKDPDLIQNGFLRKINKATSALMYDAPIKHKLQFIQYKKQFSPKYHRLLGLPKAMNYTPALDVLVIGSDEVFNCIQVNPNVGYSLELFGKDHRAKRLISYAASFGNTTLRKLEEYGKQNEIGGLLQNFHALSVRDANSADIIKKLTGREAQFHLDPVLAYDFINDCKQIPDIEKKEKYLILYAYAGRITQKESDWISDYAHKKGLKIYTIGGVQKCADYFLDCSPFEVLSYFNKAEAVITDTFHGSIFSIITQRPFATLVRKSVNGAYGNEEKLTDLLTRLGLSDHIARQQDEISSILDIHVDYTSVNELLKTERERTWSYLRTETGVA